MADQLGALGLVLNCVVLWNTVYVDAALEHLRAAGHPTTGRDPRPGRAAVSMVGWRTGATI